MKHGASAYRGGKCKCGTCTADHRDRAWRETQSRRQQVEAGTAPPFQHGAHGFTNWGCRCGTCTEANKARTRAWRAARAS